MIVRTYGRRSRGQDGRGGGSIGRTFSDSFDDDFDSDHDHEFRDSFSLSHETPSQETNNTIPFSSQESSSMWSSFDPGPHAFNSDNLSSDGGVSRKSKKPRNGKWERPSTSKSTPRHSKPSIQLTSTLMEAQESGEMMEHVDEVNFALDGLRKGQPVRIRRASLLSLLSICGTAQQRRLLRNQGMAKTINNAVLALSLDDTPSNLAAAAIFYVLTDDGQDNHLLESPTCVRFLIKLLKPVFSTDTENKARSIGNKFLALHKYFDTSQDASKLLDTSSAAIAVKVREILVSCKDMKACGDSSLVDTTELSPKWIALLTMEKACLSKISFEDTSGMISKVGGNFKEKFRELGGLDAVFEVAISCYSVMESWKRHTSPSTQDVKDGKGLESSRLLLKCLKIMENATFLSKENQSHLLAMKGNMGSHGCQLSFTKLIISIIKILSDICLLKCSSLAPMDGKPCGLHDGNDLASDVVLAAENKDCCSGRILSDKSFSVSQKSTAWSSLSASTSKTTTTERNDACQLKKRVHSSTSSSCSERLRNATNGTSVISDELTRKFSLIERPSRMKDATCELLEDSQDPYAFDEDDLKPSKWDLVHGKPKKSRRRNVGVSSRELKDRHQYQQMSQEESSNGVGYQQIASDVGRQCQQKDSCNSNAEECLSLVIDCLLTAVKVLMNLTNDNTIGCQQIAACGGLETMSSLIAAHFPSFSSSLSLSSGMKVETSSSQLDHQTEIHLNDHELDFLVAILGLLVNLVEKDGHNRSRLATASVSLHNLEGLEEESHQDVIPLLCSIFLANQGAGDASGEENVVLWNDEAAVQQGEKEAEKMIVEAYAALLLAFLSTESRSIRDSIAHYLPNHNLASLVPVLERFVAFHLTLNMIPPETHKAVSEVIEACRMP
uniref:Uncharacterized protein MANES_16G025200 n=1 Tax=Rhizophora mucronata TaxID=61149 RepID=A0A2P2LLB5_RHIMU